MKGLLLDNYFKTNSRMKPFSAILFVLGVALVLFSNNQTLAHVFIAVTIICIPTFSLIASHRDADRGWGKYELMLPVKRQTIIKSKYISFITWLLIAMAASIIFTWILNKKSSIYFDFGMSDILSIFIILIAISLNISAFFYIGLYRIGLDRIDILVFTSIILSAVFNGIIIYLLNLNDVSLEIGRIVILGISVLLFLLSYYIASFFYKKYEF